MEVNGSYIIKLNKRITYVLTDELQTDVFPNDRNWPNFHEIAQNLVCNEKTYHCHSMPSFNKIGRRK